MRSIYLAGAISGLTYDAAQSWRDEFKSFIGDRVECFSPLRAKSFLRQHGVIEQSYSDTPLSTDQGIMTRDHFDCSRADLIVCNLLGASRISVGSVMECAWAFAYRKPLILILEADNPHDHPMIRMAANFNAESVEHAAELAACILLP